MANIEDFNHTSFEDSDQKRLRHLQTVSLRNLDLNHSNMKSVFRRSSINLLNNPQASPTRQRRNTILQEYIQVENTSKGNDLIDINHSQIIDSFFSLHEFEDSSPFYVSETIKYNMNPDFGEIMNATGALSSQTQLTIKIWGKVSRLADWKLLYVASLDLNCLLPLGEDLDKYVFDKNSIIFKMATEYFLASDKPIKQLKRNPSFVERRKSGNRFPHFERGYTCSYDSVRKLNNLLYCIQENEQTKRRLSHQIDSLSRRAPVMDVSSRYAHADIKISKSTERERSTVDCLTHKLAKLNTQLSKTRSFLVHNGIINTLKEQLEMEREEFGNLIAKYHEQKEQIDKEKSRVLRDLNSIFKIENIGNTSDFTILDIHLPRRIKLSSPSTSKQSLDAALGYVTQLVYLLQHYLSVPLRYPVHPYGSKSYMIDPISAINGSRIFPLWIQDNLPHKFEYGILLLNKDIQQMIDSYDLRVAENKNLLGNVKILLLCLSVYDVNKELRNKNSDMRLIDVTRKFTGRAIPT